MEKDLILKYFINIVVFCLTLYLVILEFYGYILKPTHSSKSEEEFNSKYYPVFYVCPKTGFNIDKLRYHGYSSSLDYHAGDVYIEEKQSEEFQSWSGNQSHSIDQVMNEISTISSLDDCPNVQVVTDTNFQNIPTKLTRATFPLGRCCQADMVSPLSKPPTNVLIHFPKNKTLDSDGFLVFVTDKDSATDYEINQMKISGPEIECNKQDVALYKMKIFAEINLENDPKLKCRNYDEENSFHKVKELEIYNFSTTCLQSC